MRCRLLGGKTRHAVGTLQQVGPHPRFTDVGTEARAFGNWWKKISFLPLLPSPQRLQNLGAALGAEDQALGRCRQLGWCLLHHLELWKTYMECVNPKSGVKRGPGRSPLRTGRGGRLVAAGVCKQRRVQSEALESLRQEAGLTPSTCLRRPACCIAARPVLLLGP